MSYLPSSRLYERDLESSPAPPVAPATKQAPPAPLPAAPPRRATKKPKEWLVAPPPVLHVEAPTMPTTPEPVVETITVPVSESPAPERPQAGRKRNLFHKAHKVVLRHLDRAKMKAPDPAEPDLLWFAVMVTGSLCMGLMIWGAYSALPRIGHGPLRAETSTHKLKAFSDVPVGVREASFAHTQPHPPLHAPIAPPPLAPPVAPGAVVPAVTLPPPPSVPAIPVSAPHSPYGLPVEYRLPVVEHPAPAHGEEPLAPLPGRKEPDIFVHANRGETPMIRTWNELAKTTFLLTALTAAPVSNILAGVPALPPPQDNSDQIKALGDSIKALSKKIEDLEIDKKLNELKADLKKEFNDKIAQVNGNAPKTDSKELERINARIDQLDKLITLMSQIPAAGMAAPVAGNTNRDAILSKLDEIKVAISALRPLEKVSGFPPSTPDLAMRPATARIILVNLYNQDLWLWVNDKPYRVPAGTTRTLDDVTAGPAKIEVRSQEGIFHSANPTLLANETFTLSAR